MILTIIRHGEAGPAPVDADRQLTPAGRNDIALGGRRHHTACAGRDLPAPELLLYSDWCRTTQTAHILDDCTPGLELRQSVALRPGSTVGDVTKTLELLIENEAPTHVYLVSHQPLVSLLVDDYLGYSHLVPPLPPGGFVCLNLETPGHDCGVLLFWSFPPAYEVSR